jgi:drug/metabolite transporter (DMT)-like permease
MRFKSIIFLFLASIVLSSATPLIAKLIALGNAHQVHGRNPISFCNVLFAGNMVAFLVLIFIYSKDLSSVQLFKIGWKNWLLCLIAALLSGFLSPSLFFFGIEFTNLSFGLIRQPV